MSFLSATETTSFFEAFVSFLRSEFLWSFIDVDVHGIGVPGGSVLCGGGSVEGDRSSGQMLFGDGGREASLAEELVYFFVPSLGRGGDYFHPIDSVRKPDWNSSSEVMDDGSGMGGGIEFCLDDFELEFPHVFWEIVITANSGIGEPSGSLGGRVGALESGFKVCNEVGKGSEGGGV